MENMQSYDVPTQDVSDLTPDEASAAISKVIGQAALDAQHPYTDGRHPQHKDYGTYMKKLYDAKHSADDGLSDKERIMQEALDGKAANDEAAREKLTGEAQAELDALAELGFDAADVDASNAQPYQVETWRMQKLAAKEDYAALTPILERQLRTFNEPREVVEAFQAFTNLQNLDSAFKAGIVEQLIAYIHTGNKQRYGKKE